jgi:hypothetical protein
MAVSDIKGLGLSAVIVIEKEAVRQDAVYVQG